MELPAGWAVARLGEVLSEPLVNGRSVRTQADGFPVLRLTALKPDGVRFEAHKRGAWTEEEAAPFLVSQGDFLLSRGNGSLKLVGRGSLVRHVPMAVAFPDTMIRVRTRGEVISSAYLQLIWESPLVRTQIENAARTTAGIYKINQVLLERIEIPIPPLPEQLRIIDALEGHLSRLDVAEHELKVAQKKVRSFRKSALLAFIPETVPNSWEMSTVEKAGTVGLGRQRHPKWHHGPEMHPYLRVANVFEDRIDTSDVMEMDFSGLFERFRLVPGDVLLNEGQSPHLVGRPALYRGTPPNVAFTNSLLRFRARPDVLPEWALMVFRRHLHARRFMREVRITTNIAHLSSKRLKTVEFPIPPIEEQRRLIQECDAVMTNADAMDRAVQRNYVRARHLRNAVLNQAFTGRLVRQDPTDEPAPVLLDRICAERTIQMKPKRTPRPRKTTSATVEKAPAPTPSPRTAIQQEFQL